MVIYEPIRNANKIILQPFTIFKELIVIYIFRSTSKREYLQKHNVLFKSFINNKNS